MHYLLVYTGYDILAKVAQRSPRMRFLCRHFEAQQPTNKQDHMRLLNNEKDIYRGLGIPKALLPCFSSSKICIFCRAQ